MQSSPKVKLPSQFRVTVEPRQLAASLQDLVPDSENLKRGFSVWAAEDITVGEVRRRIVALLCCSQRPNRSATGAGSSPLFTVWLYHGKTKEIITNDDLPLADAGILPPKRGYPYPQPKVLIVFQQVHATTKGQLPPPPADMFDTLLEDQLLVDERQLKSSIKELETFFELLSETMSALSLKDDEDGNMETIESRFIQLTRLIAWNDRAIRASHKMIAEQRISKHLFDVADLKMWLALCKGVQHMYCEAISVFNSAHPNNTRTAEPLAILRQDDLDEIASSTAGVAAAEVQCGAGKLWLSSGRSAMASGSSRQTQLEDMYNLLSGTTSLMREYKKAAKIQLVHKGDSVCTVEEGCAMDINIVAGCGVQFHIPGFQASVRVFALHHAHFLGLPVCSRAALIWATTNAYCSCRLVHVTFWCLIWTAFERLKAMARATDPIRSHCHCSAQFGF